LPAEPPLDDLLAFTASYTWRVSWQATGATLAGLGLLPGGTFSTQLPVQVAEVQAINNG
jgi:hypothetical protein